VFKWILKALLGPLLKGLLRLVPSTWTVLTDGKTREGLTNLVGVVIALGLLGWMVSFARATSGQLFIGEVRGFAGESKDSEGLARILEGELNSLDSARGVFDQVENQLTQVFRRKADGVGPTDASGRMLEDFFRSIALNLEQTQSGDPWRNVQTNWDNIKGSGTVSLGVVNLESPGLVLEVRRRVLGHRFINVNLIQDAAGPTALVNLDGAKPLSVNLKDVGFLGGDPCKTGLAAGVNTCQANRLMRGVAYALAATQFSRSLEAPVSVPFGPFNFSWAVPWFWRAKNAEQNDWRSLAAFLYGVRSFSEFTVSRDQGTLRDVRVAFAQALAGPALTKVDARNLALRLAFGAHELELALEFDRISSEIVQAKRQTRIRTDCEVVQSLFSEAGSGGSAFGRAQQFYATMIRGAQSAQQKLSEVEWAVLLVQLNARQAVVAECAIAEIVQLDVHRQYKLREALESLENSRAALNRLQRLAQKSPPEQLQASKVTFGQVSAGMSLSRARLLRQMAVEITGQSDALCSYGPLKTLDRDLNSAYEITEKILSRTALEAESLGVKSLGADTLESIAEQRTALHIEQFKYLRMRADFVSAEIKLIEATRSVRSDRALVLFADLFVVLTMPVPPEARREQPRCRRLEILVPSASERTCLASQAKNALVDLLERLKKIRRERPLSAQEFWDETMARNYIDGTLKAAGISRKPGVNEGTYRRCLKPKGGSPFRG
jgi:hypothetical protein